MVDAVGIGSVVDGVVVDGAVVVVFGGSVVGDVVEVPGRVVVVMANPGGSPSSP